ncbi:peptidase S24 [Stenomitos frigidus ULC18]|uniref:Peptidase S24 n=2 Tax=Stenomitos TaxID=1844270 RepID=A0A2T1EH30_9CYAN|nr:peptidase S24 [Stenomitos frigidus ULC18]
MSFPAPTDYTYEQSLDLNTFIKNAPVTFFFRVAGEAMAAGCIHDGDLLIVDRSLDALSGKLVVAAVEGDLVIHRLCLDQGRLQLQPLTQSHPYKGDFDIWGVVTTIIHNV